MENRMQCCRLVGGLTFAPTRIGETARPRLAPSPRNSLLNRFPIPYSSPLATKVVSARSPVTFSAVRHMSRK